MNYTVFITDPARDDLDEAYAWLARQTPQHAPLWHNGLVDAILSLESNPARCPLALESRDAAEPTHQLLYGDRRHAYRILFTIRGEQVIGVCSVNLSITHNSEAAEGVNPRLLARLGAWRIYQAGGGALDMEGWVSRTQGAPWGTGFKSGYGAWIESVESVNGNSLLSQRACYLYRLVSADGGLLQWGITQDLNARYPASLFEDGTKIFEVTRGTRAEMAKLERYLVETQPGPWNHEPWAPNY